jgi:hypothetical protein
MYVLHGSGAAATQLRNGTHSDPVRIMPLGDSLTYGCGENSYAASPAFAYECCVYDGGYRSWLGMYLMGMMEAPIRFPAIPAKNVTFVGSQSSGPGAICCDHEGHVGARVKDLEALVTGWMTKPELFLLTAGTFDVTGGAAAADIAADLTSLLAAIQKQFPQAMVFLSTIPSIKATPKWDTVVDGYNGLLPGVVSQAKSAGQDVVFADINKLTTLCSPAGNDCTNDAAHPETNHIVPTVSGYTIMAMAWYQVLFPYVCGEACGPTASCKTAACGGDPAANLPGIPSNAAAYAAPLKTIAGVKVGWVGNTYGGGCKSGPCHVQPGLNTMHVQPDGTIYTIASCALALTACRH